MGKIIFGVSFVLLSLSIGGCTNENETFTGYLVAKECTPEHMSNESSKTISYAAMIIPPRVPTPPPPPHKVESVFVWYIANKSEVITKYVDSNLFISKKCGDLVTVKRW